MMNRQVEKELMFGPEAQVLWKGLKLMGEGEVPRS
jgi:hypothetical protein